MLDGPLLPETSSGVPHRWARRVDRGGTPGARRALEHLIRPAAERRLLCRFCGEPVTADEHRVEIAGRHVHRRTNPAGIEFEFGCFGEAPGAASCGRPTAEHSWFAGHLWSFALCRGCQAHLGWFFEGEGSRFHGLILDRLREEQAD